MLTSFHVHVERFPGCWSYSTESDKKADIEHKAELAYERAKEEGGAFVGPYSFRDSACPMNQRGTKADPKHPDYTDPEQEGKEPLPTCHPRYAHYQGQGPGTHWHVHTDGAENGWCRSFDSEAQAQECVQNILAGKRGYESKDSNPRVVGPVEFPAIACSYWHENKPPEE